MEQGLPILLAMMTCLLAKSLESGAAFASVVFTVTTKASHLSICSLGPRGESSSFRGGSRSDVAGASSVLASSLAVPSSGVSSSASGFPLQNIDPRASGATSATGSTLTWGSSLSPHGAWPASSSPSTAATLLAQGPSFKEEQCSSVISVHFIIGRYVFSSVSITKFPIEKAEDEIVYR